MTRTDIQVRRSALGPRPAAAPPLWLSIPVALVTLGSLLPLAYVAGQASQAGARGAFALLWRPYVARLLVGTIELCAGVTGLSLVLGVGLAWLVERTDLPGRRAWGLLFALPLAVPAFVSSFAWLSLSARSEGMAGAILILSLAEYPLVFLPVSVALRGLDGDLDNVATSLGQGAWRRLASVVLPQLRPAIGGAALLVALHMLVEFGPLAILRVDTLTTAIYAAFELEFNGPAAAVLSGLLLLLCAGLVGGEAWSRGRTRFARIGAGVPRPAIQARLGAWRLPALALGALVVALALVVPLVALIYWIAVGRSSALPLPRIAAALTGSLRLAGAGSLLTTAAALALVLVAMRFRGPLALLADRMPFAIHALPGVVVALAFVFFTLAAAPALYQTTPVLIAAYALLALPLAQSAVRAVLEQCPAGLEEVARSTGRGPWHVFRRITLPNAATGLRAALVLVFLSLLKELTATLILAPTGTDTLSMEIWSHTAKMEYGAAAPYALLLVLVSGLPAYLFGRRFRPGARSP